MNRFLIALSLTFLSLAAQAEVEVSDAWARATAPGQDVGAAYMTLKSNADATLISASSSVSDSVEIHRMWMDHGVMKMRMLEKLELPAGKLVKLAPDGFHLMLFDLKKPMKAGEKLDVLLTIKDKQGKLSSRKVELPVKAD